MKAIIPAIDISNGRCVRLSQGDFANKTVYNPNPVNLAQSYVDMGAKRIHVVDLDAAFRLGNNRSLIFEICKVCEGKCIVEVGGGVRDEEDVKMLLDMGADRLSVGTILANDYLKVIDWTHNFGNVFVGALDLKGEIVQIAGWVESGDIEADAFLELMKQVELRSIVYTNTANDGMLNGPDIEYANNVAMKSHVPIILSGGIGRMEDIELVMTNTHENIVGVIVGKAVFEGIIDLEEAFTKYPSPPCTEW